MGHGVWCRSALFLQVWVMGVQLLCQVVYVSSVGLARAVQQEQRAAFCLVLVCWMAYVAGGKLYL